VFFFFLFVFLSQLNIMLFFSFSFPHRGHARRASWTQQSYYKLHVELRQFKSDLDGWQRPMCFCVESGGRARRWIQQWGQRGRRGVMLSVNVYRYKLLIKRLTPPVEDCSSESLHWVPHYPYTCVHVPHTYVVFGKTFKFRLFIFWDS